MQTTTEAEEHLRIIRSLMEKATIYRAISAPSALVGGLLAITAAFVLIVYPEKLGATDLGSIHFTDPWIVVLVFTAVANLYFLRRDAGRRNEKFFSPGMRLAIASLFPSFFAAGVSMIAFDRPGGELTLVCVWSIFYGLGLLATTHFAPKSIWFLGWAFLLTGLGLLVRGTKLEGPDIPFDYFSTDRLANIVMASTFGAFHLVYAACTWPRRASSVSAAAAL
jgi:hypothetical protein